VGCWPFGLAAELSVCCKEEDAGGVYSRGYVLVLSLQYTHVSVSIKVFFICLLSPMSSSMKVLESTCVKCSGSLSLKYEEFYFT